MGKNETFSGKNLTKRQLELIVLMLEGQSITAAARKSGVSKTTVYRWLKISAFRERLETGRREMFAEAINGLKAAAGKAVDKLVSVMGSKDESEARRAATTVLELGFRAVEIDEYESRISALEARATTAGRGLGGLGAQVYEISSQFLPKMDGGKAAEDEGPMDKQSIVSPEKGARRVKKHDAQASK